MGPGILPAVNEHGKRGGNRRAVERSSPRAHGKVMLLGTFPLGVLYGNDAVHALCSNLSQRDRAVGSSFQSRCLPMDTDPSPVLTTRLKVAANAGTVLRNG